MTTPAPRQSTAGTPPPVKIIRLKDMDGDDEPGRDIPKRTPFDWFRHPVTEAFARANVASDAIYLDTIFKRLYNGSQTFRALLALNPEVAKVPAMINLLKKDTGAVIVGYDEIDINPTSMGRDESGHIGLWVIAHEYRHVFQLRRKAAIYEGGTLADAPNISLRSFMALHRAMEADSNTFAATCLHETLISEGLMPFQIEEAMSGTAMARIMRVHTQLASCVNEAFLDGHAATHAFDAFFHRSNKSILHFYDAKLLGIFRPFSCTEDNQSDQPDGFTARFNAMKTMPYLTEDGAAIDREKYLEEIDFTVLKDLPHSSLRNRLHRLALLAPPWGREP